MKLLLITSTGIKAFRFNPSDSKRMTSLCSDAGKQWASHMVGFFIYASNDGTYVATTIKGQDGAIESMEYRDIESNKPEFNIHDDFLAHLASQEPHAEIALNEFEAIFNDILRAPGKVRRWEVYPEVSAHYPIEH